MLNNHVGMWNRTIWFGECNQRAVSVEFQTRICGRNNTSIPRTIIHGSNCTRWKCHCKCRAIATCRRSVLSSGQCAIWPDNERLHSPIGYFVDGTECCSPEDFTSLKTWSKCTYYRMFGVLKCWKIHEGLFPVGERPVTDNDSASESKR